MKEGFFTIFMIIIFCLVLTITSVGLYAAEKELVIRQAMEDSKGAAAVEGYLEGDIFEVKVSARMTKGRPSVKNVTLIGPGIGTLVPTTVKQVYASLEEEAPYETTKIGGFIAFSGRESTKRLKGGVSRKLFKFIIPGDKIVEGGKYYLKVKINSVKQKNGLPGKATRFKFYLEKLPLLYNAS